MNICTNCVMDTTDSAIIFDMNGVCDHCNDFYTNIEPKWCYGDGRLNELNKLIKKIKIDVIIGSTNPHMKEIERICEERPEVTVRIQVSNIAELMGNADLAIGASGSATWERCCVGVPSLVWSIAENQVAIAESANEIGVCVNLGKAENVSVQIAADALNELLESKQKRIFLEENSLNLVDGQGTTLVVEELLSI